MNKNTHTKTQWLIISQKQLEETARYSKDKAALVYKLMQRYEIVFGKNHRYILCGLLPDETPFFVAMASSIDLEFNSYLNESIDETLGRMGKEEKARFQQRVFSTIYPELLGIVRAIVDAGVEREASDHMPIWTFHDLEPEESESLASLLEDAGNEAHFMEHSALQLFVEGKLERLMGDDQRLSDFNQLSDYKKTQARLQIIKEMKWEDFYAA